MDYDNKMDNYIIGTGWWCDGTGKHPGSLCNKSTDYVRKKDFFKIWYYFVNKYTNPEKIIIIDSNSPIKPDIKEDHRIEFVSLRKNFGHSTKTLPKGILCGAERAILGGAFYSYINDADFIYIEQDCLVKGIGWVENCMRNLHKGNIMYGDGEGTPQPQQQSLMIIKKDFIPSFIDKILSVNIRSYELTIKGANINNHSPESNFHKALNGFVDILPFGYGRARPINFNDKYFYAQQWTENELNTMLKKEGINKGSLMKIN
ncbi:MAG: hypothetical protein KKA19_08910 [Candidatus Margulisbacteria bacterium]|nr:hypothetical protein [Candidatus Margulisiibacteriota bacterium]